MVKTVADLELGEVGRVKKYRIHGSLGKHLREMGLVRGTTIKLERKSNGNRTRIVNHFFS